MDNYNVKKARRDDKMDLVIKSSTKILPSPNQLDIPAIHVHVNFKNDTSKSVCLSFIHDIEVYEHVSVVKNIISVGGENRCF